MKILIVTAEQLKKGYIARSPSGEIDHRKYRVIRAEVEDPSSECEDIGLSVEIAAENRKERLAVTWTDEEIASLREMLAMHKEGSQLAINFKRFEAVQMKARRERIATAALQGLLLCSGRNPDVRNAQVEYAVNCADALIAELDKVPIDAKA